MFEVRALCPQILQVNLSQKCTGGEATSSSAAVKHNSECLTGRYTFCTDLSANCRSYSKTWPAYVPTERLVETKTKHFPPSVLTPEVAVPPHRGTNKVGQERAVCCSILLIFVCSPLCIQVFDTYNQKHSNEVLQFVNPETPLPHPTRIVTLWFPTVLWQNENITECQDDRIVREVKTDQRQ